MIQPLDGPSLQDLIVVTATIVIEVKIGASAMDERKVISLQPDGKIRVFFADDGVVPSLSDLQNKGFIHYKNSMRSYEASKLQKVYILSESGSTNVTIAERA